MMTVFSPVTFLKEHSGVQKNKDNCLQRVLAPVGIHWQNCYLTRQVSTTGDTCSLVAVVAIFSKGSTSEKTRSPLISNKWLSRHVAPADRCPRSAVWCLLLTEHSVFLRASRKPGQTSMFSSYRWRGKMGWSLLSLLFCVIRQKWVSCRDLIMVLSWQVL